MYCVKSVICENELLLKFKMYSYKSFDLQFFAIAPTNTHKSFLWKVIVFSVRTNKFYDEVKKRPLLLRNRTLKALKSVKMKCFSLKLIFCVKGILLKGFSLKNKLFSSRESYFLFDFVNFITFCIENWNPFFTKIATG